MTRDEHRRKCAIAIARAFVGEGPWNNPQTKDMHRQSWISDGEDAFDSLHGLASVNPVEATEEMIETGTEARWQSPVRGADNVREIFRAMSSVGDLTRPPEKKS